LKNAAPPSQEKSRHLGLAPGPAAGVLNGLVFWALSDQDFLFANVAPYIIVLGAIAALFMIAFCVSFRRGLKQALAAVGGLVRLLYVLLVVPTQPTCIRSHPPC